MSDALAPFANFDKFIIKQKVSKRELLIGSEAKNKYDVQDERGNSILYCQESTGFFSRKLLGSARPFKFDVTVQQTGQPVLSLKADISVLKQKVTVEAPVGTVAAVLVKEIGIAPTVRVKDPSGNNVMFNVKSTSKLKAMVGSMSDVNFSVTDGAKNDVAVITKHYGGYLKEAYTDADTFMVTYTAPLNPQQKAVLLACVFHIDMVFYEK